jgi:predicted Zn-dependent protease
MPLDEILARLERIVSGSPADATEVAWIETRRCQESNGKRRRDSFEHFERTILIRVRESGRFGLHHTNTGDLSDLENSLRDALAQARLSEPRTAAPLPAGAEGPVEVPAALHDPRLAALTPAGGRELIQRIVSAPGGSAGEVVRLGWTSGRVAIVNSRGLRRRAEATAAWLDVICSPRPGAGRASDAARTLEGLGAAGVPERARARDAGPESGVTTPPPDRPVPAVLAPEAAAALIDTLNNLALTSTSFHEGTSFLRGSLGQPVFHPLVGLRDDGADLRGLPFAFDLMGWAHRPVDLVAGGVFLTPAVDGKLAGELGLTQTPNRVAPGEARAQNLILLPGETSEAELLGQADGGLWIGALEPIVGFDPLRGRFRAVARGVRRLEGGALGAPLPDLVWEDELPRLLSAVSGVGRETVTRPAGSGLFGGVTAPLLALESVAGLSAE